MKKTIGSSRTTRTNNSRDRRTTRGGAWRELTSRLYRIHELIASGSYPNARSMARALGVSSKTIRRDLDYMQQEYGIRIEYHPRKHGYYYPEKVATFPPGVPAVTEHELFALLVAHKAVAQYHGTPYHQPLAVAYHKLTAQLDHKERYTLEDFQKVLSFRPFAPEDTDYKTFEAVTQALQQHRSLKFGYRKPGEKNIEQRHVHPYHAVYNDNRWYLLAYDIARKDLRTFALCRITRPVTLGGPFLPPRNFDPEKYLSACFAVMHGEGDYEIVMEFDAWAADQLRDRKWHPSQKITELPGGGCQFRIHLGCLEEVERWILGWGVHATVVAPQALAVRIARTTAELAARYRAAIPADPQKSDSSLRFDF